MNRKNRLVVLVAILSVGLTVAAASAADTLETSYAKHLNGCPQIEEVLAGYALCSSPDTCPSRAQVDQLVACGGMTVDQARSIAVLRGDDVDSGIRIIDVVYEETATPAFSYDVEWVEKYLGGDGAIFHDGPAFRQSFTVDFGRCSGNIWLQNGLDDSDFSSNSGDELNYSGECSGERGAFSYNIGVIYIDAVGLGKVPTGDVWGPYLRLARTGKIGSLDRSESVRFEPYLPGGNTLEGGWLIHFRENVEWAAANGWGLDLSFGPTFDDGAFGFEPGIIGVVEVGVSVPIGALTLNPGYKVLTPIQGAKDRKTIHGGSLSTSISF